MTLLRVLILVCIISLATSDRCGPGGCCCETCVYLGCENVPNDSIVASDSKVYYKGAEVMTVGKLKDSFMEQRQPIGERNNSTVKVMAVDVHGFGIAVDHEFRTECIIFPYPLPRPLPIGIEMQDAELLPADSLGGFVERMWAYKTIKQLLKNADSRADTEAKKKELKDKALALSLKYNFVTELTSMVVVQDDKEIEPRFVEEKESEASGFHHASLAYSMGRAWNAQPLSSPVRYASGRMGSAPWPQQPQNLYQSSMVAVGSYSGLGSARKLPAYDSEADTDESYSADIAADAALLPTFSISDDAEEQDDATDGVDESTTTMETTICQGANQIVVDCNHPLICNVATCESVGTRVDQNATCKMTNECQKTNQTMCVCNFGYVMLNGECVEPRNCPQYNCSGNESLMTGCFADCEGVCGQPLPAYEQCNVTCNAAKCVCQRGLVRNAEGKCVQPTQCETIPRTCSDPNAELNNCGQQCTQRTCEEVQELISQMQSTENSTLAAASISLPDECNETCLGPPKCVCRQGFFLLNENDGQPTCVEIGRCPSYQCGTNETLNPCGNACDKKCSQRGQPQPCAKMCHAPACWCKPGFFRNDKNECVAEDDCEQLSTNELDSFFFL
uniref:TIL domain-containing protein n=1 Tax=Plectus sambesii TaxID=2011161 RepID=A0A914UM77_9BILA